VTKDVLFWDEDLTAGTIAWSGDASWVFGEQLVMRADRSWWEQHVHPDDLDRVRGATAVARGGRQAHWTGEYRVGVGGRWRAVREQIVLVEQAGVPVRLVGTIQDPAPAASLAERERRFATFVDELPLLAWEADASGWIDYYNKRWFSYTGTTLEEMEGWGWARVHHADDLPRMLRVWRNALENGLPWEDSFRLRRADGALRWHLSRAFPLRDASGQIVRWFGSNTDVHEQRLALEERAQLLKVEQGLRAAAEAAVREKDEFLAVLSHELRTPLSNILMRAQLLRPGVTDPRLATGLEKIEQNSVRLARLIEDLLDMSRIISGKLEIGREVVDVAAASRVAIDELAGEAEKRQISIRLIEPTAPALVVGVSLRVVQIASNLIGNAVKFSHDGGVVEVLVTSSATEVVLEVRDHGQGIEPALLPQMFERFKQGDSSIRRGHSGLGLGLSIVRHLVSAHGGRVEGESLGVGTGATFRVVFPPAGSEADRATPTPTSTPEPGASLVGMRVLGVDDDADAREVLALALIGCGATITVVGSAAEALDRLRIEVPDLIVSDLAMPAVDGFGLLERVRVSADARVRAVPVIALTAHASAQDRARSLAAGFDAYVAKPFDPGALSRLIASLVHARVVQGDG